MPTPQVNYDQVAPTYHQRYARNRLDGVRAALVELAQAQRAEMILEAGCGTGHWLVQLRPAARRVYGLDLSPGMLGEARRLQPALDRLACGRAAQLPFPGGTFDLVFCVNAFHHFDPHRAFVAEARRVLRRGGALALTGMEPRLSRDRWYLYQYFDGTYETDLRRFPPAGRVAEWMRAEGFDHIETRIVQRLSRQMRGPEVLNDPFLRKLSTSQLALLSDEAYAAGLERLRAAISEAESGGQTRLFPVDISFLMITGH
jgi:ubiquinone/menaquinone biosynthesis C-methylase UbiE